MNKSTVVFSATLLALLALGQPASAINFGTRWDGSPIPWTENLAGGSVAIDGSGYLQFTSAGGTSSLDYSGTALVQGNSPGVTFVWEDENTGGSTTLPRIDFFAQDNRAGELANRVTGGSLFTYGQYGAIRYSNPATQEFYSGNQDAVGGNLDPLGYRALPGTSVLHTLTIRKQADGSVDFTYDNAPTVSTTFLADTSVYQVTPGNPAGVTGAGLGTNHSLWDIGQIRIRFGENGEQFTARELTYLPEATNHVIKVDADSNWSTGSNWANAEPNAAGQTASFLAAATAARAINVDGNKTIDGLVFDNANSYTLSGAGTLTLGSGSTASIEVKSGSHTISAPFAIAAGTTVTRSGSGILTINGPQSSGAGAVLNTGGGLTNLNSDLGANVTLHAGDTTNFGASQHLAGLSIAAGGLVQLGAGSNKVVVTPSLSIAGDAVPTGRLDLSNNAMIVNYTGASPIATLNSQVVAGYGAGGNWQGATGIGTSLGDAGTLAVGIAEASDYGTTSFAGQTVDSTSVLLRLTKYGDANLSGTTDFSDLSSLLLSYNQAGRWAKGDFNYDGVVNFSDLSILLLNYNQSVSPIVPLGQLAAAPVPEPSTLVLGALGLVGLLGCASRRMRRSYAF